MYDEMVNNAYDEICGFDKEAAFEGVKAWHRHNVARRAEDKAHKLGTKAGHKRVSLDFDNSRNSDYGNVMGQMYSAKAERKNDATARSIKANKDAVARTEAARAILSDISAQGKEYKDAKNAYKRDKARAMADYIASERGKKNALSDELLRRNIDASNAIDRGTSKLKNMKAQSKADIYGMKMDAKGRAFNSVVDRVNALNQMDVDYGRAARNAAHGDYSAQRDLGYAGLSDNRVAAKKAAKAAEKAAAYYDEAQYVKEAAEADYAEACAYEDAAIQILDELGYLD